MAEWFQAKVKFLRQMDNGLIKQISEDYLIDSLSFTEAEGRVMLEVGEGMREVTVQKIARSPIKEVVFYGDTDLWFKTKITYSTMDEDSDKERKVTTYFLVNASNVKEAYERTETHLKDMLVPFQIPKVEESPIVDVFEHVAGLRPGLRRMEKQPDSAPETTPKQEEEEEEECAMHTDSVGASNPANGKPHEFEVPDESIDTIDQINGIFDFDLSTAQVQRIAEQCRKIPFPEFRTWMIAAHNATADQIDRVIEICKRE